MRLTKSSVVSSPEKPKSVIPDIGSIPSKLASLPRWIGWIWEQNEKRKWTKVPVTLKLVRRKVDASKIGTDHITLDEFGQLTQSPNVDGIGITLGDGLAGVDLDDCRDPETGEVDQWALEIAAVCASYTEISPTGTGLKVIGYASVEDCPPWNRKNLDTGEIEIYATSRYFCVTGQVFGEYREVKPIGDALRVIASMVDDPPPRPEPPAKTPPLTPFTPPVNSSPYPWRDLAELVQHTSGQQDGAKLAALARGDTSAYDGDASRADAALCSKLAFYLNRDAAAIDQFFRQSELMRPKWDEKHASDGRTYGQMTIQNAISLSNETWSPPTTAIAVMGSAILTPTRQARPAPPHEWAYYGLAGEFV